MSKMKCVTLFTLIICWYMGIYKIEGIPFKIPYREIQSGNVELSHPLFNKTQLTMNLNSQLGGMDHGTKSNQGFPTSTESLQQQSDSPHDLVEFVNMYKQNFTDSEYTRIMTMAQSIQNQFATSHNILRVAKSLLPNLEQYPIPNMKPTSIHSEDSYRKIIRSIEKNDFPSEFLSYYAVKSMGEEPNSITFNKQSIPGQTSIPSISLKRDTFLSFNKIR
jgi:hypothetical protein